MIGRAASRAWVVAALVVFAMSCGGTGANAPPSPERCPSGSVRPDETTLALGRPHAAARAMIADRIARQRLAVLRIGAGPDACEPSIEVLRCTRSVVWKTTPLRSPGMANPPWGAYPEPAWQRYDPRRTPEVSLAQYANASEPSWVQDLVVSGFRGPFFDPNRDEDLPPVDVSELAGPDCARATHVVRVSHGGAYRTLATTDHRVIDASACQPPASCADAIDVDVVPIGRRGCPGLTTRTPQGCVALRRPVRFAASAARPNPGDLDAPGPGARPGPCIPPVAKQPTPELARIFARFQSGDYAGSLGDLERAGAGDTRDEPGNVQLAQWYFFHAARLSGDFAGAVGALEAIANSCHAERSRAVAILAIAARRANTPPTE